MEHVRRVNNKLLSLVEFGALTAPLGSHFHVSIARMIAHGVHDASRSRTPPQRSCKRKITDSHDIAHHGHCDVAGGKDLLGMIRDNAEGCDVPTANGDNGDVSLRKIIKLPIIKIFFYNTDIDKTLSIYSK